MIIKGLNLTDAADLSKVSRTTLHNYIHGKIKNLRGHTKAAIQDLFNMMLKDGFTDKELEGFRDIKIIKQVSQPIEILLWEGIIKLNNEGKAKMLDYQKFLQEENGL